MILEISPELTPYLPDNVDFSWFMTREGKNYRDMRDRQTLKFSLAGQNYFIKIHTGVGWKEIFKNLLQGRLPVIGATNERRAIQQLEKVGVSTMTVAAFGKEGLNPAAQKSFIMTNALEDTISLEDLAEQWKRVPPTVTFRRALLIRVAEMTRIMHAAGMNHRDLYICHFLLSGDEASFELFLIDLHRAQQRANVPVRWRLKDLAALHFSSMDCGLSMTDRLRFIRAYTGVSSPKQVLRQQSDFWKKIQLKAEALYASYPGRDDGNGI